MKICPNCQHAVEDNAAFCANCGTAFAAGAGQQTPPQAPYTPPYAQAYAQPMYDPYDRTAEFDAQDISDSKPACMLVYLLGAIGIIVALLMGKDSAYTMFHIRQAIKFTVVELLTTLITAVLAFTVIVPIAAAIFIVILEILKIVCFFQVCSGKAKEAAIIRDLKFLR